MLCTSSSRRTSSARESRARDCKASSASVHMRSYVILDDPVFYDVVFMNRPGECARKCYRIVRILMLPVHLTKTFNHSQNHIINKSILRIYSVYVNK